MCSGAKRFASVFFIAPNVAVFPVKLLYMNVPFAFNPWEPGNFGPMLRFRGGFPVGLFLAFVIFTTLPRTLFHHCEEGLFPLVSHETTGVVHADAHCPICEAPIPVCDGVADFTFHVRMVPMGAHFDVAVPGHLFAFQATPRLRGPPNRG